MAPSDDQVCPRWLSRSKTIAFHRRSYTLEQARVIYVPGDVFIIRDESMRALRGKYNERAEHKTELAPRVRISIHLPYEFVVKTNSLSNE